MVTISPILNLWEAIGSSTSAENGVAHWTFTTPLGGSEKSGRSARAAYASSFRSVRDVRIHVVGWTVLGDNRVGRSQPYGSTSACLSGMTLSAVEQDLAECRSDVELLESGRMQHRERRDGGPWVDTTQRELDWHKKTIGMYEGLVRKLRAEHGGEDL
jgi:hypothetical protein